MIFFWGLLLGVPLAAAGALVLLSPARAAAAGRVFASSRIAAVVLSAVAWGWTAYECDTIGVDVFDMLLKRFPGEVWILAAVLCFLTVRWMPDNLPVRALSAILMLVPAELFKTTRLYLPESGIAPVHVLVVIAYALAVVGMYAMFYPWRIEKACAVLSKKEPLFRAAGAASLAAGAAALAAGAVL